MECVPEDLERPMICEGAPCWCGRRAGAHVIFEETGTCGAWLVERCTHRNEVCERRTRA